MKDIGHKIKDIRLKKGFSQEDLADFAKVNVRTIQRLENNHTQPHAKTLNLICQALDINAEDIFDYGKKEDKSLLILFNLSVLSFVIIPLGNIIIPLILWINKKDKVVGLKQMGAKLINFQIIWTFLFYFSLITWAIIKIMHYDYAGIFILSYLILAMVNIAICISMAIKINKDKNSTHFPGVINFIS